jgi:outer membrane protein OmpA-like peptidoglycan-associated protein
MTLAVKKFVSTRNKKTLSIFMTVSLAAALVTGTASASNAGTNVDVFFSGNTIGTVSPPSLTVDRDVVPLPLAAAVTGTRTGYSFGGWSLSIGGAPLTGSTYAFSSTAARLDLYAVWNTTITYNSNGADSGTLAGAKTSDAYRFGQALTLPTAGTLVKAGYALGGWMTASLSTNRITTYSAGSAEGGNPTLFAAWIKTVSFNANGGTSGSTPASLVHVSGGERLKLPVASEMTLRKPGYDFLGWAMTPTGTLVSNPSSYLPTVSQRTLFAIWKIQSSKAATAVFFNPDKSTLRAAQKLLIRDLVDSLSGKTSIKIALAATRAPGDLKSLGKSRNTAVVDYIRSLGVVATFTRTSTIGTGSSSTAKKNNRVSISASWTNPTN